MKQRRLPEALLKAQEEARRKTIERVEEAAQTLKEEKRMITLSNLMEVSDLSAGAWYKGHVKQYLLKKYAIGAEEAPHTNLSGLSLNDLDKEEVVDLLKNLDELRRRLASTEDKLDAEITKRKKAETELKAKSLETKVLRGELDIAMRRLRTVIGTKPKAEQTKIIKLFAREEDDDNDK